MEESPFTLSKEAEHWLERILIDAQREPMCFGFVPVITWARDFTAYRGKTVLGTYHGAHFGIGRTDLGEVPAPTYCELDLVGLRVIAHVDAIEKLRGRRLVLKSVKCKTRRDVEFLVIEHERDLMAELIRMRTLPKIGDQ
jgi:hypothetical protein